MSITKREQAVLRITDIFAAKVLVVRNILYICVCISIFIYGNIVQKA